MKRWRKSTAGTKNTFAKNKIMDAKDLMIGDFVAVNNTNKQQWIEMACEWLKGNTDMWIGFIDGFKKAMKGE